MRTIAKTFSEVAAERQQLAAAAGDERESEFWENVCVQVAKGATERIAKASTVERASNILATRIGMAKPPTRQEEITVDELDQAVTLALRRVYGAEKVNATKFDTAFDQAVKVDADLLEDWYSKSYDDTDPVDIMKRASVMKSVDELAGELQAKDSDLTHDQALVEVIEKYPKLYEIYAYGE